MTPSNDVVLPGSAQSNNAPRACDKCKTERVPEGGILMRPGRWLCASCWRLFNARK